MEFDESPELNKLFAKLGIAGPTPDSFAAAKSEAKLGVLDMAPGIGF